MGSSLASNASGARGGSRPFTEAMIGTPGYLNPLYAGDDNARDIDALVYQGLTRIGPDQQPAPLLARDVKASPDARSFEVKLRTGVLWADGQPFNADDVMFTVAALQDAGYTAPEAANWRGVVAKRAADDEVDFKLAAPDAAFPSLLRIGILPSHLFRGHDPSAITASAYSAAKALGTGPFMVDSISADRGTVRLKANPHADPAPKLDAFVFQRYSSLADAAAALTRGEVDGLGGLAAPEVAGLGRSVARLHEQRSFSFSAMLFGDDPQLASPAVRRALNQAVDRGALVHRVLAGHADPSQTSIPPSDWAYSTAAAARYPYDPGAAAAALDAAGWSFPAQGVVREKDGRQLAVTLVVAADFPDRQVADLLRSQLGRIGVQVTVETVSAKDLLSRHIVIRSYQAALVSLDNGPDPDQFAFWHSSEKAFPLNFSSLPKQSFIDKDLEDGRATSDRDARLAAYGDLQSLLADAAPALFLYEPHYEYAVSPRVAGVRLNATVDAADRFEYVTDWSLATG